MQQGKFNYSFLVKAFKQETKTVENADIKQSKTVGDRTEKQFLNTDKTLKWTNDLFLK